MSGDVRGVPRLLLRIEGAALLVCALAGYAWMGQSWWLWAALILLPDLSMIGYLAGPRIGAASYNAAHTTTVPLLLLAASLVLGSPMAAGLALVWLAHIGLDRAVGYGLKYFGGFKDTHLGSLGRAGEKASVKLSRV
ncbi:DUF4260 domain-containing protein [Methylorubrum sp. GM97]|uniref:DUF4260 domain-containing protein n=1 Tax=Methylorubrum sp. GM97 TaxID=2938232 RepID=UPI0021880BE2|nr:DUF4260 domain-containing protein [Methylorubrum sp. GM97]BDL40599.1 hypothetical protein MSPGM_31890 [Methylorubrum sp. GM97]